MARVSTEPTLLLLLFVIVLGELLFGELLLLVLYDTPVLELELSRGSMDVALLLLLLLLVEFPLVAMLLMLLRIQPMAHAVSMPTKSNTQA